MRFSVQAVVALVLFGAFVGSGLTVISQAKAPDVATSQPRPTAYDAIFTYQAEKPAGVQVYVMDDAVTRCQYLIVKAGGSTTIEPRLGRDGYPLCIGSHQGTNDDQVALQSTLMAQYMSRLAK